jgi:hypothetical protein
LPSTCSTIRIPQPSLVDDEVYRIIGISITFLDRKSNRGHLIFCLNQFDELLVSNGELFMKKNAEYSPIYRIRWFHRKCCKVSI